MKIQTINAERILSPTNISLAQYAINPYRGCPFACRYCYAQANKTVQKRHAPWGSFIDVKINAVELLDKEIQNKTISRVLLGSTVECYPPQEKNFRLTEGIIKLLNEHGIAVTILSKSCLIERDAELLSRNKDNKVYLTINFDQETHKKLFEPFSPPIKNRLRTLTILRQHAIARRVHIAPLFPFLQNIETICRMVKEDTEEISIELYNFKMGNWKEIEPLIAHTMPKEMFAAVKKAVSGKDAYEKYVAMLKESTEALARKLNKKLLLITPAYDSYYCENLSYE